MYSSSSFAPSALAIHNSTEIEFARQQKQQQLSYVTVIHQHQHQHHQPQIQQLQQLTTTFPQQSAHHPNTFVADSPWPIQSMSHPLPHHHAPSYPYHATPTCCGSMQLTAPPSSLALLTSPCWQSDMSHLLPVQAVVQPQQQGVHPMPPPAYGTPATILVSTPFPQPLSQFLPPHSQNQAMGGFVPAVQSSTLHSLTPIIPTLTPIEVMPPTTAPITTSDMPSSSTISLDHDDADPAVGQRQSQSQRPKLTPKSKAEPVAPLLSDISTTIIASISSSSSPSSKAPKRKKRPTTKPTSSATKTLAKESSIEAIPAQSAPTNDTPINEPLVTHSPITDMSAKDPSSPMRESIPSSVSSIKALSPSPSNSAVRKRKSTADPNTADPCSDPTVNADSTQQPNTAFSSPTTKSSLSSSSRSKRSSRSRSRKQVKPTAAKGQIISPTPPSQTPPAESTAPPPSVLLTPPSKRLKSNQTTPITGSSFPPVTPTNEASPSSTVLNESIGALSLVIDPILIPDDPISPEVASTFVRRSVRDRRRANGSTLLSTLTSLILTNEKHVGLDGQNKPTQALLTSLKNNFPSVGPIQLSLNRNPLKGLCVTAKEVIQPHTFVIEYAGELLTAEESCAAEEHYAGMPDVGCYMFYVKFLRKDVCIDSTAPGPGKLPGTQLPEHICPEQSHPITALTNDSSSIEPLEQTVSRRSPRNGTLASESDLSSRSSSASSSSSSSSGSSLPSSPTPSLSPATLTSETSSASSAALPTTTTTATCADPSKRVETLGYGYARYINHSRKPNLYAKLIDVPSKFIATNRSLAAKSTNSNDSSKKKRTYANALPSPSSDPVDLSSILIPRSSLHFNPLTHYPRLCFFAQRIIHPDEELTIDYGDRDPEHMKMFPWLQEGAAFSPV